ncbi:MAG: NADH-quinone oxidoreductase subunit L, partial [Candidatus Eremiobacteraeota bacterium]|nr:NADH-quinone oxidoreductase subunit L [Candidatus Eremiobacteraeota bacterium]
LIGAAAKSAQLPLQTWLPDAMEGPTPVSALIHAATMVTAGVYLIARCWPLWNASPHAAELAGTIGGMTAVAGAILGIIQWDIKRILAYSTMSQIGYMIMGVGVGAYQAGVAHFFTHAFFKALLFLGAGLLIHALADEQDVRRMGGLRKRMPFAFWCMLAGVLAISGIPGFSGFFSKDQIIQGALVHGHPWLYAAGILTAGITAYYMFRLFFVTFFGRYRGDLDPVALGMAPRPPAAHAAHDVGDEHAHAPGWMMSVPVGILAVFAVIAGYVLLGGEGSPWARFFAQTLGAQSSATASLSETFTSVLVFVVVAASALFAYSRYGTSTALAQAPERLKRESARIPAVFVRAYYFDDAFAVIVRVAQGLGMMFGRWLDPHVIDGAVREAAISSRWLGALVRSFQTGLLRAYAIVIVAGAAAFLAYYAVLGGTAH